MPVGFSSSLKFARVVLPSFPSRSAGVKALRYYSSVRCQVARVGRFVTLRVVKNKLAPPFEEVTFEMPSVA